MTMTNRQLAVIAIFVVMAGPFYAACKIAHSQEIRMIVEIDPSTEDRLELKEYVSPEPL